MEVDISLAGSGLFANGNLLVIIRGEVAESTPKNYEVNIEFVEAWIASLVDRIHKNRFLRPIQSSLRPDIKRIALFSDD